MLSYGLVGCVTSPKLPSLFSCPSRALIQIPKAESSSQAAKVRDPETEAMVQKCLTLKTFAIGSTWKEFGDVGSSSSAVEMLCIAAACIDSCRSGQTELCRLMSEELRKIASAFSDVTRPGSKTHR